MAEADGAPDAPDDEGHVDYELDDDRLDAGDDALPAPSRLPVGILLGALAALGALVFVVLFTSPGDWAGTTSSRPSPTPSVPASTSAPGPQTGVDPGRLAVTDANGTRELLPRSQSGLSVVSLCSPRTDGADRLLVGLQVVNTGPAQVRLLDVRPRLRAGLVRLAGARAGGSCGAPGDGDVMLDLAPGARVLITMELRVLDTCPGKVPVGVRVQARFTDGTRTVSFPLFADLGSVVFAGC